MKAFVERTFGEKKKREPLDANQKETRSKKKKRANTDLRLKTKTPE